MTYEVGYKKPPKASQFPKGKFGNPSGGPGTARGDNSESAELWKAVRKVKRRKVSATQGGKSVKVPGLEALLNQLLNDALRGNAKAREQFFKLAEKADQAALNGQASEPLHITITGGLPDE